MSKTRPDARTIGVEPTSLHSASNLSHYLARNVNMRYVSFVPSFVRSSNKTPMCASLLDFLLTISAVPQTRCSN